MATDFPEGHVSFPFDSCDLLLGKGGSGAVFLARHHDTKQLAAVKRCYARPSDADDHERPLYRPSPTTALPATHQDPTPSDPWAVPRQPGEGYSYAPLGNELGMREESNLEAAVLSQIPAATQQQQSTALEPTGRTDEATMLHFLGKHRQIVEYLGSYTSSRRIKFFALELMDSDVGRELRSGNGALCSEDACSVLAFNVLQALQHVHARGVAHRDVKPGNIFLKRVAKEDLAGSVLVSAGGGPQQQQQIHKPSSTNAHPRAAHSTRRRESYVQAYLGDFSAAHLVSAAGSSGLDSTTLCTRGTLYYKAPEQLLGRGLSDYAACDMWALGCTMHEMLTDEPPFAGTSELQVLMDALHKLGSDFGAYPAQTNPAVLFSAAPASSKFVDLLRHLLALDPADRYTARQALDHPLFAVIRQRQQHLAQQCPREAATGEEGIPVCFKARIVSLRCPESAQQRVSFRPVAVTPVSKRNRIDLELASMHAAAIAGNGGSPDTAQPHDYNPNHQNASALTRSPFNGDSMLSDGASLHWSQVRPQLVGASSADSSILLDGHSLYAGGEEGPYRLSCSTGHRHSSGSVGHSPQAALLSASEGALTARGSHGFYVRPGLASEPSPLFACVMKRPSRECTARGADRPVLVASTGTAFTASNLRAYYDYASSQASGGGGSSAVAATVGVAAAAPITASNSSSGSGSAAMAQRALVYSDPQRVTPPDATALRLPTGTDNRVARSFLLGVAGESITSGPSDASETPGPRAMKMFMFESPSPQVSVESPVAGPGGRKRSRQAADAPAGETPQWNGRCPANEEEASELDGINASSIIGFVTSEPLSDGTRSCSSAFSAGTPDPRRDAQREPIARANSSPTPCGHHRPSWSPAPPAQTAGPLLPEVCARVHVPARVAEFLPSRLPVAASAAPLHRSKTGSTSTPTPTPTCCSSASSLSSPRRALRECSFNTSHDAFISALCSPVPHHQFQQHSAEFGPCGLPLRAARRSKTFGGDCDAGAQGTVAPTPMHVGLALSAAARQPDRALLQELGEALSAATASAQPQFQQRHCTPSLEPLRHDASVSLARESSASHNHCQYHQHHHHHLHRRSGPLTGSEAATAVDSHPTPVRGDTECCSSAKKRSKLEAAPV